MAEIVRLRQIGIGKETTPGTGVSATHWIGVDTGIVIPEVEYVEDGSSAGRIEKPIASKVVKENAVTRFTAPARSDWLGMLLRAALGSVSSATASGESAVYEHTFTVSNSVAHPAYSVIVKDGVATERSTYSMLSKLTLSCESMGLLTCEAEFVGKALGTTTGTPSYSSDHIWKGANGSIKLATAISGLSGASAVDFSRFSLTIEKGLVQHHTLGSVTLNKNINTVLRITGELDLLYDATTYRDYVTDGAERAMQITFAGDSIGSAETSELQINLAKCAFQEFDMNDSDEDLVIQTLGFTAQFDLDEGTPQMITAVLTNEDDGSNY